MKNIELTDQSSERWLADSEQQFHRIICLRGFNLQRKLDHICLLNILLMYNFELIGPFLAIPDQAWLVCGSFTEKSSSYLY